MVTFMQMLLLSIPLMERTPRRVVSVSNFLFICGLDVAQTGLASGVTGMAGLGRTKVSFPSQFASAFIENLLFASVLPL